MINQQTPIQFDSALPTDIDVVVIGGGIIGVCTAYYLAQQGVSVFVAEKGDNDGIYSTVAPTVGGNG